MAEHAESDEVLSKGVLKMIFCRAVDLMDPEPYGRFCPIVCAALGISVVDGMAVASDAAAADQIPEAS